MMEIESLLQELSDIIIKFEDETGTVTGAEIIIQHNTYVFDGEKFVGAA